MRASIIMPTHNKAPFLDYTLEALFYQSCPQSDFEILLIDDGSEDHTPDIVKGHASRLPNLRYIPSSHLGRAQACNLGIREAKGDVLVFLDDDVICKRNLLEAHLSHYVTQQRKAVVAVRREIFSRLTGVRAALTPIVKLRMLELDPRTAGQSGPRILSDAIPDTIDLLTREDIANNPSRIHTRSVIPFVRRFKQMARIVAKEHSCPWCLFFTSNASAQREAVVDIGGFDENFHGWGEEDAEMAYSLFRAGVGFDAEPDAVVYHQVHARAANLPNTWFKNYQYFAQKHPTPEILLRWKPLWRNLDFAEYEAIVAKFQRGEYGAEELTKVRSEYEEFCELSQVFGTPDMYSVLSNSAA